MAKHEDRFVKMKIRAKVVTFEEILEEISQGDMLEPSYASKMLAALSPEKPIWDSRVITLNEMPGFGRIDTSGKDSDLMHNLIVNLGDVEESVENQILRLMNVLLSTKTDVREKQRVMREEFHIAMAKELEVEMLCNLSQGIYNEGFETGIEKGIQGAVEILCEKGYKDRQIIERIQKRYGLTLEEAEKYVIVQI